MKRKINEVEEGRDRREIKNRIQDGTEYYSAVHYSTVQYNILQYKLVSLTIFALELL